MTSTSCRPNNSSSRRRLLHFVAEGKCFISVERLAQNDTRHQRLFYLKVSKFLSPATEVLASLGVCWLRPCGYPGPGRDPSSQLVMLTIRISGSQPRATLPSRDTWQSLEGLVQDHRCCSTSQKVQDSSPHPPKEDPALSVSVAVVGRPGQHHGVS